MVTVPYSVDIYRIHHALAAPTAVKLGGDRLLQERALTIQPAREAIPRPQASKKAQQWRKGAAGPYDYKNE